MHILIIPSWYKTPQQPVTGTFFEEQARMLQRKGYKVGILYPDHVMRFDLFQSHRKNQPSDLIDDGIPTYYSFTNSIIPRTKKINFWYACFKANKVYRKYKTQFGTPDIIHAHATFIGGLVANYISKKNKIPYLLTEHYTGLILDKHIVNDLTDRNIIKMVFNNANKSITVSHFFKQKLIETYDIEPNNIIVIPNVVNPIFYSSFIPKQTSPPFVILCVAFLTERKQHKLLFDAVNQLTNKTYQIHLKLIGDGAYKDELVKYVKEKKLQSIVTFMGNQSREIVKQEIDNSHLLVSASAFETFGVNLIEALACGRPVVAIDSGGPRDIVTPENGILVKENSAPKLAEAVKEIIGNYESYNQRKIVNDCIKRFSEDVIFEKLERVYQSVCQ